MNDDDLAVLDEWVQKVVTADRVVTERALALYMRPKPTWMPKWAWRRMVGMVLLQTERWL